ncbi:MAG: NUDIX domain-containing protein [Clostridiaceae bacterium]|nr:NUDIX domain-containing protein [Clostridiaceae bacterium]
MRIIQTWDDRNYDPAWKRFVRRASRAVIIRNGKVAMVKSTVEGYYKFPGGGVKRGEGRIGALIREAREEAGLSIIFHSIREIGMMREIRKSIYGEQIFDQRSYYYLAKVKNKILPQKLEPYEQELGFELRFVDAQIAYQSNIELAGGQTDGFVLREARVLKEIIDGGI